MRKFFTFLFVVLCCSRLLAQNTVEVKGCTDPHSLNYNSHATVNDGSCKYAHDAVIVKGCMDSHSLNYNPNATMSDGSCTYAHDAVKGCTDPHSLNYNPQATLNDGSCTYAHDSTATGVKGCTDPHSINYNVHATINDGSCKYIHDSTDVKGCTDPHSLNYNAHATINDGSCKYHDSTAVKGCTDPHSLNYDSRATLNDGSCQYTHDPVTVIWGCMDHNSTNYNPDATKSNGHCLYKDSVIKVMGCMDPLATNFNPFANHSDNSCLKVPVNIHHTTTGIIIKDTVSVKPVIHCSFDYVTKIDSAKIITDNIPVGNDSTPVTWAIHQGSNVSNHTVKYLVNLAGNHLFVLTLVCEGTNKMQGTPQAVTVAAVENTGMVTGLSSNSNQLNDLTLYPNPTSNQINISGDLKNIQKVSIYSIFGQELLTSTSAESKLDVSSFPTGNYFVRIQSTRGVQVMKFVK